MSMQTYTCALFLAHFLTAGLLSHGLLTTSEPEGGSGNDNTPDDNPDFLFSTSSDTLPTLPTEREAETDITQGTDITDINQGYVVVNDFNTTSLNDSIPLEANTLDITSILLYTIPVFILLLLAPLIVFFVKRHRRKTQEKETKANEDIRSPIFEEDTPSVMEIEMEELDKWMSNLKNGKRLSTLEEENKFYVDKSEGES